MRPRTLILPFSAIVIAALVTWRLQHEPARQDQSPETIGVRQLAPRFELYDQRSQLVKFERYLGRTKVLVYFFDGQSDPAANTLLIQLRDNYKRLQAAGIEVVAVSSATPFAIREAERMAGQIFPFPVLTDIDRQSPLPVPVHRIWGLADDEATELRGGLFVIDRDGSVTSRHGFPASIEDPAEFIKRITSPAS